MVHFCSATNNIYQRLTGTLLLRRSQAKIPDDTLHSVIIEFATSSNISNDPKLFDSDNTVEIKKIIGSKAVFSVDCKDEYCWFVYNTAALTGWRAFSGPERLPIQKANLGFIGVKLDRGNHLLWLEYRPWVRDIALLLTLLAWGSILSYFIWVLKGKIFNKASFSNEV